MFGHQNDDQQDTNAIPDESIKGALAEKVIEPSHSDEPAADQTSHASSDDTSSSADDGTAPVVKPDPVPAPLGDDPTWQHPGEPIDDKQPISDVISPAGGYPKVPAFPQTNHGSYTSSDDTSHSDDSSGQGGSGDTSNQLIDIKQHALSELAPMIDNLDLDAEDKFRTIMMMIQAGDDQSLIAKAYDAAHDIDDEKVRAQALLDIVNEINYFTQQPATEN